MSIEITFNGRKYLATGTLYLEPMEEPEPIPEPVPLPVPLPEPQPKPHAPSPTGRAPRIFWSPAWQATWERARAEAHPWFSWLEMAVANPDQAYFDKHLYPTLLYQITGVEHYARQAWAKLNEITEPTRAVSQDAIRANWLTWMICYEWLYPALTEAERAQCLAHFDRCANLVAKVPLADSDRVNAAFFGVAVSAKLGSSVAQGVLASEHFGGLELSSESDVPTVRRAMSRFAGLAEGGEWLEGTSYNRGTTTTFLQGLKALEDLGVRDELEDLWQPVQDFASAAIHRMTSDLAGQMTWGATQDLWLHKISRYDFLLPGWATMAELAGDGALRGLIHRTWVSTGKYGQKPRAEFYLAADPYARFQEMGADDSLHHVCQGQQMFFARSNWEPGASCLMFRCGRHNQAHHNTGDAGDFQLWRRGEWAVSHAWAYDDLLHSDGLGRNNSLLVGNQPLNFERREMLGAGVTGGCFWMLMATGGPWQHGTGAVEYLHSHLRWLVYLPSADQTSDVILVRDVLNVDQPTDQTATRKAYNLGRADERHAAYMAGGIPLVQWIIHAPRQPSFGTRGPAGSITWETAAGQIVNVAPLLPANRHLELVDESRLFAELPMWMVAASERGWQARFSPVDFQGGNLELLFAVVVTDLERLPPAVALEDDVRVGQRLVRFGDQGVEVQ